MKGGDATYSWAPNCTMRNNYNKENYPSRRDLQGRDLQVMRGQQQNNLQGYINLLTVQQWTRQGAGNPVDRDRAHNQNLCFRCGLSRHVARDCEIWNQRNRNPQQSGNDGTVAAITQGME